MQNKSQDRWKINKIGLINYWWYDEEELCFSDGRMILRGTNGSGKSVTMQSFIPLLLDGKRSAERLDPFGNRARKIEDYVLGYGDNIKDENTSYLYMEFLKENTESYRTVGIGLNGKKGQGVKFWGFIIKDGRRVGKDLFLYKDLSNKIPLTKLELKNRIGLGGEVVDSQKEYEKLVNDNIFGFQSLEEFDEFIKLLIEIRTPKLSDGKGFRPSTVIEILTNSLRPLSDEDLRPVSESIDNMNKMKEQLYFLTQSKKAVDKIKGYYEEYNQYLLYEKAKRFQDENKKFKDDIAEKETLEKDLSTKKEEIKGLEVQLQELEAKLTATNLKKRTLEESEAWKVQENLKNIETALNELEKEIINKTSQVENKEKAKRENEEELRKIQEVYEKSMKDFNEQKEELGEQAKDIFYDEYFFKLDEIEKDFYQEFRFENFYLDLQRYMDRIKKGKDALEKFKSVENDCNKAEEEIEKMKNKRNMQEADVTKNRNLRDEEKTKLEDQMYCWEKENEVFKLKDDEKVRIAQKMIRYGDETSLDDIKGALREPYNGIRQNLLDNAGAIEREKKETIKVIESKKAELEEWKNKKDPEPVRTDFVMESRKKLVAKGVEFLPFYQTVDFKSDVSDETKGMIESALQDMGILDALVVSEKDLENILNEKSEFVDKFLVPNPIEFRHDLTEFMEVSLPENSKISAELIVNLLKTILIDDKASQNYIDEDGVYKIGFVTGFTNKNAESILIGQESRRKYRQKQIEFIEEELESLGIEKQELEEKEVAIKEKIEKLNREFDSFPDGNSLEEKQKLLRESIYKLDSMKREIDDKNANLVEMYENLKQIRVEVEEKTSKMQIATKWEAYSQAFDTATLLMNNLHVLANIHDRIVSKNRERNIIEDGSENINLDLDNLRYDLNQAENKRKEKLESKKALEEIALKAGNDLIKQMDECLDLLQRLPKEIVEVNSKKSGIMAVVLEREEKLDDIKKRLLISEMKRNLAEDIFRQELNLGYFSFENEDLLETMKSVLKRYHDFEKQSKNLAGYYSDLVQNLKDNQEYLVDFNLTMEDIFVSTMDGENQELIELMKTRTRKDITCFVKGKKVNFFSLMEEINLAIEETKNLIDEDDRRLFEEILTNTVGRKIRKSIYDAKSWVSAMNRLMETIDTSSKLSFSLNWKPKVATDESEMDTKELVDILEEESKVMRPERISKVANHFRSKFEKATKRAKEMGSVVSFHDIMKETLDYRMWYEFQFNYKKGNDSKKELTNNAFFKLSGGEKAMAMYIPLFAAVTSKFQSATETAPRIISLDEAFAGVDDANIRDMFRILTELDLEYIINSQVLWGEYDTIPSLAINELISDPESMTVAVIRYKWNGYKKELII